MAGNLYEQGYYETGTASVTQGQTVVTGQGTAWSQIVRPADDFGKHVGMPIPIASVDSDTQITLAYPWPGPTQAAAPYRVTFTPYHVAYRQALQEIGQLLSSGNVSALAGLSLAAGNYLRATGPGAMETVAGGNLDALAGLAGENGKFPVFTGAETMATAQLSDYAGNVVGPGASTDDYVALFDGASGKLLKDGFAVSVFMRTLLDDADAASGRSTLKTPLVANLAANTDLNGVVDSGFYRLSGPHPNLPSVGFNYGQMIVSRGDGSDSVLQLVGGLNNSLLAFRTGTPAAAGGAGGWNDWQTAYSNGSILGAVSQVGGVPTGAIIERGSNANGEYVRFADGTQICYGTDASLTTADTAEGSFFRNLNPTTLNYPASFIIAPHAVPFVNKANQASGGLNLAAHSGLSPSPSSISMFLFGTFSGANGYLAYVAVGRWF